MGWIDLLGIVGGLLFLFAFYRTSIGRWTGKSLWYELDNLAGAILMSIYALSKGAYVNIALNVVWAIVAFRGLTSIAERRNWYGQIKRINKK
jgi:hypothetical protein